MGKNRKWDDPTPRSREKCLEVAKEAAAKVFSRLIAEGKIDPSDESHEPPLVATKRDELVNKPEHAFTSSPSPPPQPTDGQMFSCEIEINDIAYACRNLLTKSVTQDDILKVSGAKVATRGRFMTSEEKAHAASSGERPLYLSVQGGSQQNVDLAVQRISGIIFSLCNIPLSSLSISSGTTNIKTIMSSASMMSYSMPTLAFVQDKLFVGLEHAPPNFNVKQKILGPGGSYLQHIQSETGAKVMLRGKGSGFIEPTSGREAFEPMFIYLQHGNQFGLQHAKQLAQNLLETVQRDYANFQQALALAPPAVNPGTASILAGLHQSSFPSPNSMWNSPIQGAVNYNSGLLYPSGMVGSPPQAGGAFNPGPCSVPYPSLRMPTDPPSAVHPFPRMLPPPPPPPPATQISSVSAALSYYEQYVLPPSAGPEVGHDGPPALHEEGRSARPHKRRFQEKLEEENDSEDGRPDEGRVGLHTDTVNSPSLDDKKDNSKENACLGSTSLDSDGFVVPPPLLKRKRPQSKLTTDEQPPFKVPLQPKQFQGALKSVLACYGSGSDDDDDDDDEGREDESK